MAEAAAQARPEPVGADQRDAVFLHGVHAVRGRDRDAAVVNGEVVDLVPRWSSISGVASTASRSAACKSPRWMTQ